MSDENNEPELDSQEQPAMTNEDSTTQSEEISEEGEIEQPVHQPQARPAQAIRQRAPGDENTIFIGRKSTMGYVLAVVTQFNSGAALVKVKARGKLISKAVDVAEIARGRFLPDVKPSGIIIMTEEVQNEDGTRSKVSSIEISLSK